MLNGEFCIMLVNLLTAVSVGLSWYGLQKAAFIVAVGSENERRSGSLIPRQSFVTWGFAPFCHFLTFG